jgi:hypothetical protein
MNADEELNVNKSAYAGTDNDSSMTSSKYLWNLICTPLRSTVLFHIVSKPYTSTLR